VTNAQVKHIIMLIVAGAWLIYVLVGIWRNQLPETWTWGIPSGCYVALYQPWVGRQNAGDGGQSGQGSGPSGDQPR
jgi:hypothetical protein